MTTTVDPHNLWGETTPNSNSPTNNEGITGLRSIRGEFATISPNPQALTLCYWLVRSLGVVGCWGSPRGMLEAHRIFGNNSRWAWHKLYYKYSNHIHRTTDDESQFSKPYWNFYAIGIFVEQKAIDWKFRGLASLIHFANGLHGIMWEPLRNNFYGCELIFLPTRSQMWKETYWEIKDHNCKNSNPKESVLHFQLGLSWRIPANANSTLGTVGVEHLIRCLLPWLLRSLRTLIWRKMTVGTRTPKLSLTAELLWVTSWIIQKQ